MGTTQKCLVAPSILAADFTNIREALARIEQCGGDMVHLDVMDGHFVPKITFGCQMVEAIKKCTSLPLDVHLMVSNPEHLISSFLDSGADYLTFHYEAEIHHLRLVEMIKRGGAKAGISLVPSTPVCVLEELYAELDMILIMSVNPGSGGQTLIPSTLKKLSYIVNRKRQSGYRYITSVDGGINHNTIADVHATGVDLIVAGSAFFRAENPCKELELLKNKALIN